MLIESHADGDLTAVIAMLLAFAMPGLWVAPTSTSSSSSSSLRNGKIRQSRRPLIFADFTLICPLLFPFS